MELVDIGTELKLNVHLDKVDGKSAAEYDFNVEFYTFQKKLVIPKEELTKVDDDNYIALVNTNDVGCGELKARITAYIPDSDFGDNYRKEVLTVNTGVKIK